MGTAQIADHGLPRSSLSEYPRSSASAGVDIGDEQLASMTTRPSAIDLMMLS